MGDSEEADVVSVHLSTVVEAGDNGGLGIGGGWLLDDAVLPDPVEMVEWGQGNR